ncbi:histidine phosphatase family protein [Pseudodesulfovibrio sediminis]|uniref:Phosphoglycerate mutase n=1 Tax=Pseudodesulfovibrio sediminis TaxID=2810563 RepID=A0ABM8HYY6_9BACT|nr:histidine phosphatase family protein [Pseudodesulfovibrio sediminis]BCS88055.1 phosphoglycerate mutase [Pseudodesulfovibrio sediminis]
MILLARHAQTVGGKGRCIGRTALPLSDIGKEQAKHMAEALVHIPLRRLCTSPSQRALDTIAPLARRLDTMPEVHHQLDEIDMGEWDGVPFDDIQKDYPEAYAKRGMDFSGFQPPNGESFNQVAERAMAVLNALAQGPRPVLAVTHAGVIRSVLCRLMQHTLDDLFNFKPAHACMTIIWRGPTGLEIIETNVAPEDVGRYVK